MSSPKSKASQFRLPGYFKPNASKPQLASSVGSNLLLKVNSSVKSLAGLKSPKLSSTSKIEVLPSASLFKKPIKLVKK